MSINKTISKLNKIGEINNQPPLTISFIGRHNLLVVMKNNCAVIVARTIMKNSGQLSIASKRPSPHTLSGPIEPKYSAKEVHLSANEQSGRFLDYYQSKYWIILQGTALLSCDGQSQILCGGQSQFIAAMTEHRIKNVGNGDLIFVEFRAKQKLLGDELIEFIEQPNIAALAV